MSEILTHSHSELLSITAHCSWIVTKKKNILYSPKALYLIFVSLFSLSLLSSLFLGSSSLLVIVDLCLFVADLSSSSSIFATSSPICPHRHRSLPLRHRSVMSSSISPSLSLICLRFASIANIAHSATSSPIYLRFTNLWLSLSHTNLSSICWSMIISLSHLGFQFGHILVGLLFGFGWWVCDLVLDGYGLWWAGGDGYLFDGLLRWTSGGWWWVGMSFMVCFWVWVWVWVCDFILGLFLFVILVVVGWGCRQWWLW